MDIAPVHAVLSKVVALVVADRDVLTDGNGIEVLNLQQHVIAVDADGVTIVVGCHICTHDTFVVGIGVGQRELRPVGTTGQGQ